MVCHEASSSRLPRNESLFSVHRGKKNDYVIRHSVTDLLSDVILYRRDNTGCPKKPENY
jgi:hypothetical protein